MGDHGAQHAGDRARRDTNRCLSCRVVFHAPHPAGLPDLNRELTEYEKRLRRPNGDEDVN